MKKVTNQILVFSLLVVLVGCSPSDEGGGGGSTAKSYGLTEGGSVRNMTAGDYWNFTGTVTAKQAGSTTTNFNMESEQTDSNGGVTQYSSLPIVVRATTTKSVAQDDGQVSQNTSQNYFVVSGGVDYFMMEQGGDNLFYAINKLNGEPYAAAKIVSDGSYSTGYTIDACGSYSGYTCVNPTTVANVTATYTIIGPETVSTPMGNFESHKIKVSFTQTSINTSAFSNVSSSATYWYYPALGIVKQTWTSEFTDSSPSLINEGTMTMKSTNNSKYSRTQRGSDLMSPFSISQMLRPIQ